MVLAYSGAWTATSNASFLQISAGSASGTGNGVVAFTFDSVRWHGNTHRHSDHRRLYGHRDPGGNQLYRAGPGDHAGVAG